MVSKVLAYRRHVDAHMSTLLKSGLSAETAALLRLGLAHEEQHQELLFDGPAASVSQSPSRPAYDPRWPADEPGRSGRFRPAKFSAFLPTTVTSCPSRNSNSVSGLET